MCLPSFLPYAKEEKNNSLKTDACSDIHAKLFLQIGDLTTWSEKFKICFMSHMGLQRKIPHDSTNTSLKIDIGLIILLIVCLCPCSLIKKPLGEIMNPYCKYCPPLHFQTHAQCHAESIKFRINTRKLKLIRQHISNADFLFGYPIWYISSSIFSFG